MIGWRRDETVIDDDFLKDLHAYFGPGDPFEHIMSLKGDILRSVDGRRTFRFELGGSSYFAKLHTGMPFRRVVRKLFQFRLPVLGAGPEWLAIHRLMDLGVSTTPPVAFGLRRGWNPLRERSFVITRDLGSTVTLEQECLGWPEKPPRLAYRIQLIREIARIARVLHEAGMNHRDFYLCHFRLDTNEDEQAVREGKKKPILHLMDLHRVQHHEKVPMRALVKDLGGLYFSALDSAFTQRDLFRFIEAYRRMPLRRTMHQDSLLWQKVAKRANWQYRREHGQAPKAVFR